MGEHDPDLLLDKHHRLCPNHRPVIRMIEVLRSHFPSFSQGWSFRYMFTWPCPTSRSLPALLFLPISEYLSKDVFGPTSHALPREAGTPSTWLPLMTIRMCRPLVMVINGRKLIKAGSVEACTMGTQKICGLRFFRWRDRVPSQGTLGSPYLSGRKNSSTKILGTLF